MVTCVISYYWWLQWLLVLYYIMGGYSGYLSYIISWVVIIVTCVISYYSWLLMFYYIVWGCSGYLCYIVMYTVACVYIICFPFGIEEITLSLTHLNFCP